MRITSRELKKQERFHNYMESELEKMGWTREACGYWADPCELTAHYPTSVAYRLAMQRIQEARKYNLERKSGRLGKIHHTPLPSSKRKRAVRPVDYHVHKEEPDKQGVMDSGMCLSVLAAIL